MPFNVTAFTHMHTAPRSLALCARVGGLSPRPLVTQPTGAIAAIATAPKAGAELRADEALVLVHAQRAQNKGSTRLHDHIRVCVEPEDAVGLGRTERPGSETTLNMMRGTY